MLKEEFPKVQGPRRVRPFAPLASPEPDPHEQRAEYPASLREKLTGAHLTLQPQYRRKPPYRTGEDGTATMSFSDDIGVEACNWARCFGMDVRKCIIRSHLHRCGPTCWKYTKHDVPQHCKVCRLVFITNTRLWFIAIPGGSIRRVPTSVGAVARGRTWFCRKARGSSMVRHRRKC